MNSSFHSSNILSFFTENEEKETEDETTEKPETNDEPKEEL